MSLELAYTMSHNIPFTGLYNQQPSAQQPLTYTTQDTQHLHLPQQYQKQQFQPQSGAPYRQPSLQMHSYGSTPALPIQSMQMYPVLEEQPKHRPSIHQQFQTYQIQPSSSIQSGPSTPTAYAINPQHHPQFLPTTASTSISSASSSSYQLYPPHAASQSYIYTTPQDINMRNSSIVNLQTHASFEIPNATNTNTTTATTSPANYSSVGPLPPNPQKSPPSRSHSMSVWRLKNPNTSANSGASKDQKNTSTVKDKEAKKPITKLRKDSQEDVTKENEEISNKSEDLHTPSTSSSTPALAAVENNSDHSGSPSTPGLSKEKTIEAVGGERTKKTRSRHGCLTCRARKKRCSESRPSCKECERLGLTCKWANLKTGNKNKSKNKLGYDEMYHETFGVIKILRGIVDYKVKNSEITWKRPGYTIIEED